VLRRDGRYLTWVEGTCRAHDCLLRVPAHEIWCQQHHQQFLSRLAQRLAPAADTSESVLLEIQEWLRRLVTNRRRSEPSEYID
jgi:hypothetical protein